MVRATNVVLLILGITAFSTTYGSETGELRSLKEAAAFANSTSVENAAPFLERALTRGRLHFRYGSRTFYIDRALKLNWFGALLYCRFHGLDLAAVDSVEIQTLLVTSIKTNDLKDRYWIGGFNLESKDVKQYHWVNSGEKMIYTKWAPGEPNNANGKENCAHLDDTDNGNWNDLACETIMAFICEGSSK